MQLNTVREFEQIVDGLEEIFPYQYPSILRIAHRHGFLDRLANSLKRVYTEAFVLRDKALIESLLTAALYHCTRSYCYIMHASMLMQTGYSMQEVKNLTELLELPESVNNRPKWNNILKMTFFSFRGDYVTVPNINEAKKLLSNLEFEDYAQIVNLAHNLKHIIYFYGDEIDENRDIELLLEKLEIEKEIQELVKYYDHAHGQEKLPVVSMCMFCKDVRNADGKWFPIEIAVQALKENSLFSHGVCDRCLALNMKAQ